MALSPIEFRLREGETIAGIVKGQDTDDFTILFVHDLGTDLDAMLPILGQLGLGAARKVAIDLPGHGLSSGTFDAGHMNDVLEALREAMRARGWAPFLYVAAGTMAPFALRLADAPDTLGVSLVSPRIGDVAAGEAPPRCPVLAFVSSSDAAPSAEWQTIRARLRSWWLAVSMKVDHDALRTGGEGSAGQIAAHLQGFARDMYVTSPLLAGRGERAAARGSER